MTTKPMDLSRVCNIVAVGDKPHPFGLDPEYVRLGPAFYAPRLMAAHQAGVRLHMLWLPLGWRKRSHNGMPMYDFDMRDEVRRIAPKVADPAEWARVLKPLRNAGSRVILYYGGLGSETLNALKAPGKADDWARAIIENAKIALDSGCDMAVDASAIVPADTWDWTALQLIRTLCRISTSGLWLEAVPPYHATHLCGWNVCALESHWQAQRGNQYMRRMDMGAVLRWLPLDKRASESDADYGVRVRRDFPGQVAEVIGQGDIPGFDYSWLQSIRALPVPGVGNGQGQEAGE